MNKAEFEAAYRRYMEEGGHSYDSWDINHAWADYQNFPEKYEWLE